VAIVTGSAQGLGRETVRLLASVGAKTVIVDINADGAKQTVDEIEVAGGIAFACRVDLGSADSVKNLFAAVDSHFGGVDILVNNAADRSKAEFFDMSVTQLDRMLEITARGTFLCCREAITRMQRCGVGGPIVNISSVGSLRTTL
jgi:NAD(P)-dependent dehydrogenase (short-subunit alcohol dehydrogenase family)